MLNYSLAPRNATMVVFRIHLCIDNIMISHLPTFPPKQKMLQETYVLTLRD